MKQKSEFSTQRSMALLNSFREALARESYITVRKIFKEAADAPAPRFWVGENRAARIVSMMLKGADPTSGMNTEKRKMYLEIYRRVKELKTLNPEAPVGDLVFEVVNSPAPHSYLSWQRAREIIADARHKKRL